MNGQDSGRGSRRVAMALAALLAGCAGLDSTGTPSVETLSGHDYVLAFLTFGARAGELDKAAVAAASEGHRAHIDSMGAEGTLLLAGPFGEPRADESWRGIYVFNLSEVDEAYELARSDPSVVAGLFDVMLMPWRSDVDLRPLRTELEEGKAAGAPFVPAAYVLAIGEPTEQMGAVLRRLGGEERIICAGELGGEREGQFLLLLTAETVEEARAWLESGDPRADWELSSLWATAVLGGLAERN